MYHPVIKNKLNELKGLNDLKDYENIQPIIELVDSKYSTMEENINYLLKKVDELPDNKNIFIDIPTYINNDIYNDFDLSDINNKFQLFKDMESSFLNNKRTLTPVISFDFSYESEKKSYKENIKFVKKMLNNFNKLAIRVFANEAFKNNDISLLSQLYDFLGDEIENMDISLIFETTKNTKKDIEDLIRSITDDYRINNIILLGEAFNDSTRHKTGHVYDRIHNKHLKNFLEIKKYILNDKIKNVFYADYTLLEKIQVKLSIDPLKGFLYYPFIKFTTEDGNMCYFSAREKGNYEQYQELCELILNNIRTFSSEHCKTCKFIEDVANGVHKKFKAGSTWKYRMIAHHITTMRNLF